MSDCEHPMEPRRMRPWLCFRIGPQPYAVPLEAAAEIIEVEGLIRLPLHPPGIAGYCLYRRDLVPVVTVAGPPEEGSCAAAGHRVIVILRTAQGTWGFAIDREGAFVAEDVLDPDAWRASESAAAVLIGSIRRQAHTHAVIDPEPTWRRLRAAIERAQGLPVEAPAPGARGGVS